MMWARFSVLIIGGTLCLFCSKIQAESFARSRGVNRFKAASAVPETLNAPQRGQAWWMPSNPANMGSANSALHTSQGSRSSVDIFLGPNAAHQATDWKREALEIGSPACAC